MSITPLKMSCHACAIIPGRRLFVTSASVQNIAPYAVIAIIPAAPSYP